MTLNCRSRKARRLLTRKQFRIFADGREIHSVWYYDGRRKILKTYDVRDDGTLATATVGCPFPIDPSWEAPIDGVLSKTIYAKQLRIERLH